MTPYQFFKEQFNLNFKDYIDTTLSVAFGKPILDTYKFDVWLREQYGNFEEEGHSMLTLLKKHYGEEVAAQIQKYV